MNKPLPEIIALYTRYMLGPYSWLDDRRTVYMPEYYGYENIKTTF